MGNSRQICLGCLCVLVAGMTSSCFYYRHTDDGRVIPISTGNWALRGAMQDASKTNPLNTNVLYISEEERDDDPRGFPDYHGYGYLRFWADGHVCSKGMMRTFPTNSDANSFADCAVGYYAVYGSNIFVETFFVDLNFGNYLMQAGTIVDGNVVLSRNWLRHSKWDALAPSSWDKRQWGYGAIIFCRPVDVGPLTSSPDW